MDTAWTRKDKRVVCMQQSRVMEVEHVAKKLVEIVSLPCQKLKMYLSETLAIYLVDGV